VRRRCDQLSNYFDHLLVLLTTLILIVFILTGVWTIGVVCVDDCFKHVVYRVFYVWLQVNIAKVTRILFHIHQLQFAETLQLLLNIS